MHATCRWWELGVRVMVHSLGGWPVSHDGCLHKVGSGKQDEIVGVHGVNSRFE